MTPMQFGVAVGLALGAIWAFGGFGSAVIAAVLALVGLLVAMVAGGRIDLTEYLGHRGENRRSPR